MKLLLFYIVFACLLNACNSNDRATGLKAMPADTSSVPAPSRDSSRMTETPQTITVSSNIDTLRYNQLMQSLANGDSLGRWPVKTAYPLKGALLPYHRIIAYYGNFYSKGMGILGEYEPAIMIQKLKDQANEWQQADTTTTVMIALHYIAVTAQGSAGDGYYRLRMPEKEIQKAIDLADSAGAIVFLDMQVGLSNLQNELPRLEKYLRLPNVHLGIDPEFSMKTGKRPGTVIGTMDASDINYASSFLAKVVNANNIPPKVLVIHRFTNGMLTNYKLIDTKPEVQLVIHMDGFGSPVLKNNTYQSYIVRQPVQFTGFKIFYKNDSKRGGRIMTPKELLDLQPRPSYIQYQ